MTRHLSRFAFLMALAHFTLEVCSSNFLPVVYPRLIETLGLSYGQIGLIALVGSLTGALIQPLFGFLSDRWGPTRLATLSIVWLGGLMGLVGFVNSYPLLLVLVGLAMLGSAAFHPAGAVLASMTSDKGRGAALSIFSVAGNLGSAVSPLLVAVGLSWLGVKGTVVIIPVALLVGLLLYQQLASQTDWVNDHLQTHRAQQATQARGLETSLILGLALVTLMVMARSWFQMALITYLPEWIHSQGQSLAFGGQVLSIMLVATGVGSFIGGPLSDRIGRWQIAVLSLTLLSLAQWAFLNSAIYWQVGLVAVMGLLIGATFPVTIAMAQETWPRGVGLALALVMGLGWAPGGLGAWVTGFIADQASLAVGLQTLILPPLLGVVAVAAFALVQRRSFNPSPA